MDAPSCPVHLGARMRLRPQPVPQFTKSPDAFTREEGLRRRMWVCEVPDCHRVAVAPAAPRPPKLCTGCGAVLARTNLTEYHLCRPCRAKRERR